MFFFFCCVSFRLLSCRRFCFSSEVELELGGWCRFDDLRISSAELGVLGASQCCLPVAATVWRLGSLLRTLIAASLGFWVADLKEVRFEVYFALADAGDPTLLHLSVQSLSCRSFRESVGQSVPGMWIAWIWTVLLFLVKGLFGGLLDCIYQIES